MPRTLVTITKTCQECNREFVTNREKAKFCSSRCRVAAHRAANGVVTKRTAEHTTCIRGDCSNDIPSDSRSDTKYCSNACRQKVYNEKNKHKVQAEYAEKVRVKKQKEAIINAEQESERIADEFLRELTGE